MPRHKTAAQGRKSLRRIISQHKPHYKPVAETVKTGYNKGGAVEMLLCGTQYRPA
jgi:hypothetical protein